VFWRYRGRGHAGDCAGHDTGFREALQDRLLGVTAHIALTRPGSGGIHDYEALASKLAQIPGVRSVHLPFTKPC